MERKMYVDNVIVGGSIGGVAAALAAANAGKQVIMTEETSWIRGQLTSQAVPPDEHPWIESFGCTRSYREFREGIRDMKCLLHTYTAAVSPYLIVMCFKMQKLMETILYPLPFEAWIQEMLCS